MYVKEQDKKVTQNSKWMKVEILRNLYIILIYTVN
jgi:hypothetical protein